MAVESGYFASRCSECRHLLNSIADHEVRQVRYIPTDNLSVSVMHKRGQRASQIIATYSSHKMAD